MARYVKGETRNNKNGRPIGSKNKMTLHREKLEAGIPEILDCLLNQAKNGELAAIKLILERTIPPLKNQSPTVNIELFSTGTLAEQGQALFQAATAGLISTDEGSALMSMLSAQIRILETTDLDARIQALEAQNATKGSRL